MIECTGVGQLIFDAMSATGPNGIVCLTGVSSGQRTVPINGADLGKAMVLGNDVVFGSVNANRRHYEKGAEALANADPAWLGRLITRKVPIDRWHEALERQPGDVKPIIVFGDDPN